MFCSFHIQNAAHIAQKRIIPQRPLIKAIADLFEVPRPYVRLADRYRVLLQLCPIGLSKKDPFCKRFIHNGKHRVFFNHLKLLFYISKLQILLFLEETADFLQTASVLCKDIV